VDVLVDGDGIFEFKFGDATAANTISVNTKGWYLPRGI
jgi:hypothetical protein